MLERSSKTLGRCMRAPALFSRTSLAYHDVAGLELALRSYNDRRRQRRSRPKEELPLRVTLQLLLQNRA